jgi:hypothetical protein
VVSKFLSKKKLVLQSKGRLTSNFVIDMDQMESLSTDGATVRLFCPFSQTGVMQYMTADLNQSYRIVVVVIWRLTVVTAGAVRLGRFNSRHRWLWRCINGCG